MDRGTTNVPHLLAQYLFKHAEGRKSGVGYQEGTSFGAWLCILGPERQQDAAASTHEVGSATKEVTPEIPAPAQAPPPPPPAPQPRTMSQRIKRIEEE
ncbi:hypothetical protein Tco_0402912, partial [Tanacetum coccineum]